MADTDHDNTPESLAADAASGMSVTSPEEGPPADIDSEPEFAPSQLGHQRFVYAGFLSLGVGIAFLATKIGAGVWHLLQKRYPQVGDPRDEWVYPAAILAGILITLYCWRRDSTRQYAEEVAEELSKVSWPSKAEVTNSTTIVVVTTIVATIFFAMLDQFWRFVTDKVYGI
jgi:preprotein translocase subunit SecE